MQNAFRHYSKTPLGKKLLFLASPEKLSWLAIGLGILVRIIQYLYNRSLWADEAVLALNIVNRSYLELLQPLDYDQGAPIGFLWVEKLAVQLLGDREYALRLFPLVSGIISILLFYIFVKRFLPRTAVPIALAFFASLPHLVYYSTEVKQYSSDVAIALICYFIALNLSSPQLSFRKAIILGIGGAIAIWFSHPAVLVLGGVSLSVLAISFLKQKPLKIAYILAIGSTWLLSFLAFYLISIKGLSSDPELLQSWGTAFPSPPFNLIWYLDAFGKFFYRPLGFGEYFDGLAILAFAFGCISYFHRKKEGLWLLLSPLFITFFAAALEQYPFRSRLVLFLTPFIILLIAEGVDYIRRKTQRKRIAIASLFLSVLLLAPPLIDSSKLLVQPYLKGEIKMVLDYVKKYQRSQDVLYVFQRGIYQFKYYAQKYGYQEGDYILGVDDLDHLDGNEGITEEEWQRYQKDLDNLKGNPRVWVLFSHAHVRSENERIKAYLDSMGKRLDFFARPGAFVYLYDLTNNQTLLWPMPQVSSNQILPLPTSPQAIYSKENDGRVQNLHFVVGANPSIRPENL